ncbi:flippase [Cohnella hashimotonis]|uniref:Flippase n=1 Tax=Cohnella hashimotonis TaxID=2826895 RepID=A0ABT6TTY6_9BACL|nr:flippase [Cohnella hashimotonis]MDI4650329.1 flippase [Cohnella hashimotonis]
MTKYVPKMIREKLSNKVIILSNISWLVFDRFFRMGVGVFVSIWVARYLGPSDFGLLNFAQAFVALFAAFSALGLDGIVVRNLAHHAEKKREILGTTFLLKLVGGVLLTVVSLVTILVIRGDDHQSVLLVMVVSLGSIFQSMDAIDFWFQANIKSKFTVYARSASFIMISILKVGLILTGADLMAFAIAGVLEIGLGSIFMMFIYQKKEFDLFKWKARFSLARNLLRDSWPLIFSNIVVVIYMKIDQIMLGQLKNSENVGIYSAAVRLSEVWYFIPTAIVSSLAPIIASSKRDGNRIKYDTLNQQLFNVVAILSIGIAIPMTFLSDTIVNLLYGNEYAVAGKVLNIHIWSAIFVFLGVARNPYILNEGLMKFSFATNGIGALTNIILNLFLIPKYGMIGAAYATLISQAFASYLTNALYSKTRPLFIYQTKALFLTWILRRENRGNQ